MADRSWLEWPFFEPAHRALAAEVERFADRTLDRLRVPARCRS
ncbi:MAG TPA: hypothetical protein VHQ91_11260 [Geminicoccaceae bacterium]|nr:hypothetical protein [Geminicoccaceae bacterium]